MNRARSYLQLAAVVTVLAVAFAVGTLYRRTRRLRP